MEIKFTKVRENAIDPVLNSDGSVSIFAINAESAFDAARKPVIVYSTGLSVNIPEDYIALVTPPRSNVTRSVSLEKDMILTNDNPSAIKDNNELTIEYKITTDAAPITYSKDEEVARLYPIKKTKFTITIDEYVAPVNEPTEEGVVKEEGIKELNAEDLV